MENEVLQHSFDYQIIINIGISVFGILLGTVLTVLFRKLTENSDEIKTLHRLHRELSVDVERQVKDLSIIVVSGYTTKEEFNRIIDKLFDKLDRIESKIESKQDKEH